MPSFEQKLQAREKERKIIELRLRGVQVDQIAKEFHVRPQRISFLVKRALKQIPASVAEQERARQIAILERVAQRYWAIVEDNKGDWEAQNCGLQGVLRVENDRRHMLGLNIPVPIAQETITVTSGLTEPTAIAVRRVIFEGYGLAGPTSPEPEPALEIEATEFTPDTDRSSNAELISEAFK